MMVSKKDVFVTVLCTVFMLLTLGAMGLSSRERAKRAVCMSNMRALTAAWAMYSDDNGEYLVNASQGFAKSMPGGAAGGQCGPANWPPWVGDIFRLLNYAANGDLESQAAMLKGPEDVTQVRGTPIQGTNLLWKYCPNLKLYKCPTGDRGQMLTYSIVDMMAGAATWDNCPGPDVVPDYMMRTQIKQPAVHFVWVDEGFITPDSWTVSYDQPRWYDVPPGQHNIGGTFSFADGHVEYHKWVTQEVRALSQLPRWQAQQYMQQTDWTCNEDLEWVQIHAWGQLGYDPQALGCP